MEVDAGATFSVVVESALQLWHPPLEILPSNVTLITFSGEIIEAVGKAYVNVEYQGQHTSFKMWIASVTCMALSRLDWIQVMRLNRCEFVMVVAWSPWVNQLDQTGEKKDKFPLLFCEKDGQLKDFKAHLQLEPDPQTQIQENKRGILLREKEIGLKIPEAVCWGCHGKYNPLWLGITAMTVLKHDGPVGVCGDHTVTINPILKHEVYPLPTLVDLFTKL